MSKRISIKVKTALATALVVTLCAADLLPIESLFAEERTVCDHVYVPGTVDVSEAGPESAEEVDGDPSDYTEGTQMNPRDKQVDISGLWNWYSYYDNQNIGTLMTPDRQWSSPIYRKSDGSLAAEAVMTIGEEPEWTLEAEDAGTFIYPVAFICAYLREDRSGVDFEKLGIRYIRVTAKAAGPIRFSILNEKYRDDMVTIGTDRLFPSEEPGVYVDNSTVYKTEVYDMTPTEYGFVGNSGDQFTLYDYTDKNDAPKGSELIKCITGLKWEVKDPKGGSGKISVKSVEFLDENKQLVDPACLTGIYNVSFDANGGKGTMAKQTFDYGVKTELPVCSYSIDDEDLAFAGWNTKKDGSGTSYQDGSVISSLFVEPGNNVLYAQWKKPLTHSDITVDKIQDRKWTKKPVEPVVVVKDKEKDITDACVFRFCNNTNVGRASVIISANKIGAYCGTKTEYFEILKAEPEYTAPAPIEDLYYNGKPQKLVSEGTVFGGDFLYAVTTNANYIPGKTEFSEGVPEMTEAGKYIVWFLIRGDRNHEDVAPQKTEAVIHENADDTPGGGEDSTPSKGGVSVSSEVVDGVTVKTVKYNDAYAVEQKVDVSAYLSAHKKFIVEPKGAGKINKKKRIVTLKKPGEVIITGYDKEEKKLVPKERIRLTAQSAKLKEKKLEATAKGKSIDGAANIDDGVLVPDKWESSKPAVAKVDEKNGLISPLAKGNATITAYYGTDKGALRIKFKVKVKE